MKPASPKQKILKALTDQYGPLKKLEAGNSLFLTGSGLRFYVRYSKLHRGNRGFFGLDKKILRSLVKEDSYVCFVFPIDKVFVIPAKIILACLRTAKAAYDDSYKVQVVLEEGSGWLYVPKRNRLDISQYLDRFPFAPKVDSLPGESDEIFEAKAGFTHEQIQHMMLKIGKPEQTEGKRLKKARSLEKDVFPSLSLLHPGVLCKQLKASMSFGSKRILFGRSPSLKLNTLQAFTQDFSASMTS